MKFFKDDKIKDRAFKNLFAKGIVGYVVLIVAGLVTKLVTIFFLLAMLWMLICLALSIYEMKKAGYEL